MGWWELHFRGRTNGINAFPVERRERRVPQVYKPSAKWLQMCLQPSFFEATILWNVYRARPHYKNSLLWRRRELKTAIAVIRHSELPKIKVLGSLWCKTKDFYNFARTIRLLASQEFSFWKAYFHHWTFYDVHSFMITVIACDRWLCPNDTKECRKNKSWLTVVFMLLILLNLHLFKNL